MFKWIKKELNRLIGVKEDEGILSRIRPVKFQEYIFSPDKITVFYETFREHQRAAVSAIEGKDIGQIIIPTGAGKTYIQKYVHVKDMIDKTIAGATGIYVISAHRLVLCSQLFKEIIDLVIKCGLKTDLLYIGSGRYPFEKLNYTYRKHGFSKDTIKVHQTTSKSQVNEFVERSKRIGHHVLIVTTYHSFDCMADIDSIDICTFDEAQTTTEDRHRQNIELVWLNIKRKFFFTATRRVIGDSGGQNDFDFYGPMLYEMSPREAVEAGEIVAPLVHIIKFKEGEYGIDKKKNIGMLVRTIIGAFTEHEKKVKETSYNPDEIEAKMLVTNSGLDEIQSIINDEMFKLWCKENNIKVFNFSSRPGEEGMNSENLKREEMLDRMYSLDAKEKAILLHYDILAEGIDLPAITGVMLLRGTLSLIKLVQTIGRACRLHPTDRLNLYSGEINPGQTDRMIKPFSWIILPVYINENWKDVQDVIEKLRESYDIFIEHASTTDLSNTSENIAPNSVLEPDRPRKDSLLDKELEHVFEGIELKELDTEYSSAKDKKAFFFKYIKDKQKCQNIQNH